MWSKSLKRVVIIQKIYLKPSECKIGLFIGKIRSFLVKISQKIFRHAEYESARRD